MFVDKKWWQMYVIVGILIRQNFQFMKVNIVSINPEAVDTIFINKTL